MPGNSHLKRVLNQSAWSCSRARNAPRLRSWFWSLAKRAGKQKAIVALSRKILVTVWAMLKSGELYNPNYPSSASR